jgi:hypothetical protein
MIFITSLIFYCTIAAVGAFVCLTSWRERIVAKAKLYRPEKHYMRGPGPKCRERHASGRLERVR